MILSKQPKTFIIALKDHPISLSQLNDCLVSAKKYAWDVRIFWAIHGRTLSLDSWKEIGVTPLLHKGSMNKLGTWGCFFSHWHLWNKCVELNEPIIILEHDAVIQSVWDPIEISDALIKLHQDYLPDSIHWIDIDSGKCSWSSHAYCITPEHANKLIHFAKNVGGYAVDRMIGSKVLPVIHMGNPTIVDRQNTYSTTENL
jgi:GR25 family glycosyltransferase involved in LPS biosynthesis